DKDLHWDNADRKEIRAMCTVPQTVRALSGRLPSIEAILRDIPSLSGFAKFYAPDQVDDEIVAALRRLTSGSNIPELLGSLLFLEGQLVENAVRCGTEMGRFRAAAMKDPAKALENLAKFGEDMARTFNQTLGNHPFLSGASRPL